MIENTLTDETSAVKGFPSIFGDMPPLERLPVARELFIVETDDDEDDVFSCSSNSIIIMETDDESDEQPCFVPPPRPIPEGKRERIDLTSDDDNVILENIPVDPAAHNESHESTLIRSHLFDPRTQKKVHAHHQFGDAGLQFHVEFEGRACPSQREWVHEAHVDFDIIKTYMEGAGITHRRFLFPNAIERNVQPACEHCSAVFVSRQAARFTRMHRCRCPGVAYDVCYVCFEQEVCVCNKCHTAVRRVRPGEIPWCEFFGFGPNLAPPAPAHEDFPIPSFA